MFIIKIYYKYKTSWSETFDLYSIESTTWC